MNVFWIPVTAIIGSFVMVVLVVFFGTRSKQRRAELRADVQMRLIDKFGSSAEFVQFLNSAEGQQFLEQPRRMSRDRVLGAITGGFVTAFLGLAFIGCAFALHDEGFFVPGFILLAVGLGLFISAAISWKLTKQLEPPAAGTAPGAPAIRS